MKATYLEVGNHTDIGLNPAREKNEDYYGRFDGEFGTLLILCDGIGGNVGGEMASRLAVESIHYYINKFHIPTEENMIITQAFEYAQQKIMEKVNEDPSLAGMGSTVVMILIREHQFWYAHIGDSRLYLRRDDSLTRLTRDHSEVQNLVDLGVIKPEEARSHPRRNVLSKALGHDIGDPEVSGPHMLYQDDVFLLCSDGLTEYLDDTELLDYMAETPQVAAHNLVDEAKRRGGMDNITVQIVSVLHGSGKKPVEDTQQEVTNRPPLNIKKYVVPALILILAVYILIQIPKACSRVLSRKPLTAEDSLRIAQKAEAKAAKEAAKRNEKEAKKQGKTPEKGSTEPQLDPAVDSALSAKLSAKPAQDKYRKILDDIRAANPGSKLPSQISFISNQPDGRAVFVTPGQGIYLAFNYLANEQKVNVEQLEYIIALAAAMGDASRAANKATGVDAYFGGAAQNLDNATLEHAKKLYLAYKPNTEFDFKRIGNAILPNTKQANLTLIYHKP